MTERLDGLPRKKWKWREDQLRNSHVNNQYHGLDRILLQHFKGCHDRVRDGKCPSIQWPRTRNGFIAFIKTIGSKPKTKGRWTVGRIKHAIGYQDGNIQWELYEVNSVKRKGTRYINSKATTTGELYARNFD